MAHPERPSSTDPFSLKSPEPPRTLSFRTMVSQPIVFPPVVFDPPRSQQEILSLRVTRAAAVAGHPKRGGGNRWCLHLAASEFTDEVQTSVLINIEPLTVPSTVIQGGYKAQITFFLLGGQWKPDEAVKLCWCRVRKDSTVRDVFDSIMACGAEKYEFTDDGRGCRWWTLDQIRRFFEEGLLVDEAEVRELKEAITKEWPSAEPISKMAEGQYYL